MSSAAGGGRPVSGARTKRPSGGRVGSPTSGVAPGFLSLKSSKHQAAQAPSADGHLFVRRDKSRASRPATESNTDESNAMMTSSTSTSSSSSSSVAAAAAAVEEFVDHWCVLRDGLLNAYRVSDGTRAAFDPRTDALPAKPSLSCDVTTLRGLEVSDSTLEFAFVCDDTLTVRFRCATIGEARFWVHCIQRAVLHCAGLKRKLSTSAIRRGSAIGVTGGGGGVADDPAAPAAANDAMRRHTLGGQSSWKFSKTNTFCGSMFEVYSALETGRRRTMEDECVVVHDLNADFGLDTALYPPQALFALYDGHAGRGAVDFAVQHMNRLLLATTANDARTLPRSNSSCSSGSSVSLTTSSASQVDSTSVDDGDSPPITPKFGGTSPSDPLLLVRPAVALRSAFLQCDEQFRKQACEEGDVSGTTAIVALLRARRLFVANAGDSRAVLCRNARAIDLSTDHKPTPNLTDEIRRIEDAGGWITAHEVLNVPKLYALGLDEDELDEEAEELVGWVTVRRVNGVLGMTRSLGDILIKDWRDQQFEDAEFKEGAELVIADPEVLTHEIQNGDQFFIIASDGLWDVFSSQDAVDFVRKHDDRTRAARQYLVQELVNEAMERGSIDNISVLLVFFNTDHFGAAHAIEGELSVFRSKRQAFSRRFAVLSKADRTLLLYRSRVDMLEGKSAIDVLMLQNVKACHEVANPSSDATGASPASANRFLFQLTTGGTTTLLSAATDAERQRWIALLGSTKLAQN